MPSFLIKHGTVWYNGKLCGVDTTIELNDSDAKALSESGVGSILVDVPVEAVEVVVESTPVVEEITAPIESEPAPEVEPEPVPRRKRQS